MSTTLGGFQTLAGRDPIRFAGAPVDGVDEVQTLNSTATGGTFKVNFTDPRNGQARQTAAIAWNASAAVIIAAMHAVTGVPAGSFSATGGPINTTPVVITHIGEFSGLNVAPMTIDNTLATGGTVTVAQTTAGVPGTGRGADKGALLSDTDTPKLHMNTGTKEKPVWGVVGGQS